MNLVSKLKNKIKKVAKPLAGLILFSTISSVGVAGDYSCFAKANPNRGFKSDFDIQLKPATVGGKMILKSGSKEIELGSISEVATLNIADPGMQDAFGATLGLVAEEDVSGVADADINSISSLQIYKSVTASGDEMFIYQLYKGGIQLGGTFLASGMGTACLKK